jgi:hypothetical protein
MSLDCNSGDIKRYFRILWKDPSLKVPSENAGKLKN